MKLIEVTSRSAGAMQIFVNLNTGEGRKPHEIGIFACCEIPEYLMEREICFMIPGEYCLKICLMPE